LPMYCELSDQQQDRIVDEVTNWLNQ